MEIKGLDEVQRELSRLAEKAHKLEGTHSVSAAELLAPAFIQAHTRQYDTAQEWFDASPFRVESSEDFAAIPDAEWDAYVRSTTDFSSWQEMLEDAGRELIERKLFGR